MLAKVNNHRECRYREHRFLFFSKTVHDHAGISVHDQTRITVHDPQESPFTMGRNTHLPNYYIRKLNNKPISSQLAESSVNSVINKRQKNQQMLWSRSGAHNILQIRTAQFSDRWEKDWGELKKDLYKKAA